MNKSKLPASGNKGGKSKEQEENVYDRKNRIES